MQRKTKRPDAQVTFGYAGGAGVAAACCCNALRAPIARVLSLSGTKTWSW